jgi:hypothetical protein
MGRQFKPGNIHHGSGSTPNLFGDLVAIYDNANPINVQFHNRSDGALVGSIPASAVPGTENAPIGMARTGPSGTEYSLIVENNYGWTHYTDLNNGQSTGGGITRVDLIPDGVGGYTTTEVWTSPEYAPTCVPKLSLATGLIYVYTKPPRVDGLDAFYFTAIDFETGETVWSICTGTGFLYDNNWAPVNLGSQGGTAYIGALGGMVMVQDQP